MASIESILEQLEAITLPRNTPDTCFKTEIQDTKALLQKICREICKINQTNDRLFAKPARSLRMQRAVKDVEEWSMELQRKKASLAKTRCMQSRVDARY